MTIIAPSVAPRLEFFVTSSAGAASTALTHASVTSASYILITAGVRGAPVAISLSGTSVDSTAAKSTGQFVTLSSVRGHYAIDAPSGAALSTADEVRLDMVMVDGTLVTYPIVHVIDTTVSSRASQASVDTIIDGIGWTLASLYGVCANPQAADTLVQLTINGYAYSGQYAGLTSAGVRTAPTLSKV